MKIKRILTNHEDYGCNFTIEIDGKEVFRVGDGEPEDNTLGRNFNDCYRIESLLKLAYEAGKNGEELIMESETIEE